MAAKRSSDSRPWSGDWPNYSRSAGAILDCTRGKELFRTTSTKGTEVLGRLWHIICMQQFFEDVLCDQTAQGKQIPYYSGRGLFA